MARRRDAPITGAGRGAALMITTTRQASGAGWLVTADTVTGLLVIV